MPDVERTSGLELDLHNMIVKEERHSQATRRYAKTKKESPTVKKLKRRRAQRDVWDDQIESKKKIVDN